MAVSVVAIPALLWLLFRDDARGFCVLIALASLGALAEVLALLRKTGRRPFAAVAYAGALAAHAVAAAEFMDRDFGGMVAAPVALLALLLIALLLAQFPRGMDPRNLPDMAASLFAALYAGFLPSFIIRLRGLPEGARWVALLLVLTWVYDSAAYFWGKSVGRTKLWLAVSPGKTWEGYVGGIATVMAVAWGLRHAQSAVAGWPYLLPETVSAASLLWLAPLVATAAQLGDLAESMLKRTAKAKDSGALLPGHGGLLDKLDGFLFAAPLLYVVALAVL